MGSALPRDIPGYYWDPEKNRYFREATSHLATRSDAPWSSDNVKKRKIENAVVAEKARYQARNVSRIKRSRELLQPLMGGFFAREYGGDIRDLRPTVFARGLVEKGKVVVSLWKRTPLKCVRVGGVKRANGGYHVLSSSHLSESLSISSLEPDKQTGGFVELPTTSRILLGANVSDIKFNSTSTVAFIGLDNYESYHPSGSLITLRLNNVQNLAAVPPPNPNPILYVTNRTVDVITICVSPNGTENQCLAGTDLGLMKLTKTGVFSLITPPPEKNTDVYTNAKSFKNVFGVDYHHTDPNVVFFGGRPGKLFIGDLRQSPNEWNCIQLPKSISHVKTVNDNQVLVTGLQSMMSVYDTRFCDLANVNDTYNTSWGPKRHVAGNPVVTMPEYECYSRFNTGFDLDRSMGVVATTHDDNTIALYSVRSGRRLPFRSVKTDTTTGTTERVYCIQFETLEGERSPTLFVGGKNDLTAYSLDPGKMDI
ncbi:hypothetical protein F5B19DRAFT_450486 [Rostrohypoxylon terebratum]|nr:hypothetical protein F5B19DRAFT_450486 [Rostrohypoxylon terebratum]